MTSWQARATFNVSRLTYLYENEIESDVTFIVGEEPERRYDLHKLVLSMWSPVLSEMLIGPGPSRREFHIPDIEPDIFEIAMKFIYEEIFTVQSLKEAMDTYLLAERYRIELLGTRCFHYINNNIYPENIPILYTMPELLDRLQLRSKCQTVLSEKTSAVLRSNCFLNSPILILQDILKMDELDIEGEGELLQFVLNWSRSECDRQNLECTATNIRSIMDCFLPYIRFKAMTMREFFSGLVSAGILTDTEIAQISQNLAIPGSRSLPEWCSRQGARNSERSFHFLGCHSCSFSDVVVSSVECTMRLMNGNMKLRGLSVRAQTSDESTVFTVTKDERQILANARFSYDTDSRVLNFTLLDPVAIHSSSEYKISVTSNKAIFPKCCQVLASPFIRHHSNFELICTMKDPQHLLPPGSSAILNGCAHFYQIFYSR